MGQMSGVNAVDYTPPAGSLLDVVAKAHPNQDVRCGNSVAKASGIARDVRQMLAEIERLTTENAMQSALIMKLDAYASRTCIECGHS